MNPTPTRHIISHTRIGDLTIVATDDAVTGIYFPGHWTRPNTRLFGPCVDAAADALLAEAERQVLAFLDGQRTDFDLPTAADGDEFQLRVWELLCDIPFGETVTYGEIAERYGDKRLARDVGQAVGSNPLAMIVPCHRVIGKDGKLTGYAGGLERKRALLELEGSLKPEPVALTLWGD